MTDSRFDDLAEVLIGFSIHVQKNERVLIDTIDIPPEMVVSLIRNVLRKGAFPFVNLHSNVVTRELLRAAAEEQYRIISEVQLTQIKLMHAYVSLRGGDNLLELSDVPSDDMRLSMKLLKPVVEHRVNNTKWVVVRWPSVGLAQMAGMSTETFETFFFKVCTLDYARMKPGMTALRSLLEDTDRVHITGPGTDLHFSVQGIPAISCGGEHNVPDGEVFTAPIRESVEGYIHYNASSIYQGSTFDSIRLGFKQGKVVEATASNSQRLNEILDSDAGARYVGEFGIGFNPHLRTPIRDILFDEKIAGSLHLALGQAYSVADNGNRSQIHWDLICIQTPENGGGEIYFDEKLVRKNGLFVAKDLELLNPENLI